MYVLSSPNISSIRFKSGEYSGKYNNNLVAHLLYFVWAVKWYVVYNENRFWGRLPATVRQQFFDKALEDLSICCPFIHSEMYNPILSIRR
jgi:hypothetical protein